MKDFSIEVNVENAEVVALKALVRVDIVVDGKKIGQHEEWVRVPPKEGD